MKEEGVIVQWNEYTITTTTQAEDLISDMLMELGVNGVEILDNQPISEKEKEELYIDILPELPEDQGIGYVKFYLDAGNQEQDIKMLEQIKQEMKELEEFVPVGLAKITKTITDDKDWINNWKEFFKPFYLDDILIRPSWETGNPVTEDQIVIEIDPGTSFGTGQHETTQLCIRQLKKYLEKNDQVLDLGCGSGILSLICLKLGASKVIGTDVDPICREASMDNMKKNDINEEDFCFLLGNLITDENLKNQIIQNKTDLVVANILADIIIPMAPAVYPILKVGGIFITSGIIDFKEKQVEQALVDAGFQLVETTYQGEWVSITVRK